MHDTLNVKIEDRIVKLIDKAISTNTHQLDPEWYQIIINNWAQITVFLGLIGFIVAKFIDRKIRKEITIKLIEIDYDKIVNDNDVADACGIGHWAINNWNKAMRIEE